MSNLQQQLTTTILSSCNSAMITSSAAAGYGRHGMPLPPPTLTFNRLTLKLVCESHLRWGTFLPNLGRLCLRVLELFAMYATTDRQTNGPETDRQTDGRTKQHYCPFPTVRGILIIVTVICNYNNKCIGDDTKAAPRGSPNCIRKTRNTFGGTRISVSLPKFCEKLLPHT